MGMGMSVNPQIWQQFVDLVFQNDLIKCKQNFDVIMDDTFIHLTAEEHMDDLMDLFKVLRKYGLKLSSHKCQFFMKKIVYMGLEFQVQGDKVCYTPLKDKCDDIRNLESPKTLRQTRAFCRMVNFLSSFLPNLCRLLILFYDLQKKAKMFKWTDEAEKAFNEIKKLLISPPVLKAPTPDGLFQLKSDTSREGVLDDTLIRIENLNSGYLIHCILDPKILAKYLEAVGDDLEETVPEFELVFTSVYQYYGNCLISFTNTIDDLLLQLPILIKLKVQVHFSASKQCQFY